MRVNTGALSQALDHIQVALFEPSRWPSILEEISKATGALGANIMVPTGQGAFGAALSTENFEDFREGYMREEWNVRDFRTRLLTPVHRFGVVIETDFVQQNEFDQQEYYKFMRKYGIRDAVLMDIAWDKDPLYFVLQNSVTENSPHQEDMVYFQSIRTRLQTAAQLARHIAASKVHGMSAAFETSNIACIFFDGTGRVTLTNAKADAFLLAGDLQIAHGKVRAHLQEETIGFNSVLMKALKVPGSDSAVLSAVRISRPGKRPLIVRFERFGQQLADVFSHSCAVALIQDPDDETSLPPDTLTALFDLTPTEARISLLVASGLSAVDIASQHGIGYETVRSHIRSIFQKTRTGRQSELSALLGKIRL